jgi:hypothetical protein
MKSETFIKILRQVVREEVQQVVREELKLLIETPITEKSIVESKKPTIKNSLIESIKPTKPTTQAPAKTTPFTNNGILNDILNETANGGEWRSVIEGNSSMAPNFGMIGLGDVSAPTAKVVESVDQMLASARPSSDVAHVQIDAVPDFSALMSTMKEKGQI